MEPLLDTLTLAPAAQLFELEPPRYTSSYGRRTEAIFKHNVPPAPMLISPDNGLVLYERVISTKAEHQLLDKLTKPKYYHPTPSVKKAKAGAHNGAATGATVPAKRPDSGHSRPHSSHDSTATGSASPQGGPSASGPPTAAPGARSWFQPLVHQHPSRSVSAGRAVGAAGGHPMRRKPLYPEDGPLKDYFSKERASVTATTTFTWGNRYKLADCTTGRVTGGGGGVGGGGLGGGRGRGGGGGGVSDSAVYASYAPLQQKPPLRL